MAFIVGQRVIFTDQEIGFSAWFYAASMSLDGVVMQLNARNKQGEIKPITGRILEIDAERNGNVDIAFRPDGWLTPEEMWPRGFKMSAKYFKPYPEDAPEIPGTIMGGDGKPVSEEKIAEAVEKRMQKDGK